MTVVCLTTLLIRVRKKLCTTRLFQFVKICHLKSAPLFKNQRKTTQLLPSPPAMSMYPQRTQHQQRLTELLDAIKTEFDYASNEASSFKRSRKIMTQSTNNKLPKCNKSAKQCMTWSWPIENQKRHTRKRY